MITDIDLSAEAAANARWESIAKPVGSLGELERLITRMAGIQGTADVRADRRKIVVFCADNGVTEEGICSSDPAVTAVVAANIATGCGNVSTMAKAAGCEVSCVDVGMFSYGEHIFRCRVRPGTQNFAKEPAMTPAEAETAISVGMGIAGKLADDGMDLLLAGEVGIGNTTTSAAVAAALLNLPANAVAGRGAGLDDEGLARKVRVIDEALDKYGLRREKPDAFRVLCCVGGLDIAAMAGFYIGCARHRVPAILDGAISAAAALLAERLAPGTKNYLLASHASREPMAALLLKELGLTPVLHADLALGEGTGAVCLLPLIDLALAAYNNAATFAESGLTI